MIDFEDLARRVCALEEGRPSGRQKSGETATLDWVSRNYYGEATEPAAGTESASEKSMQEGSSHE